MFWFKKIALGFALIALIYCGSSGTQSSSLFVQAVSFVGLLVVLVILYIFGKMLLRGLGCLPSMMIMGGIGLFMMYALGMFNNGLTGVHDAILSFIGRDNPKENVQEMPLVPAVQTEPEVLNVEEKEPPLKPEMQTKQPSGELFDDVRESSEKEAKAEATPQQQERKNLVETLVSAISSPKQAEAQRPFNPNDFPVIYAYARVINGDTLEIMGRYFRLFGIAAPEISQTCADWQGRAYNCGRQAASWLKSWIEDGELECHIIQQDTKGNMVGTCSYGPYDLGAAIVNAGWAVAYTKYTDAYLPYEYQAQKNRRGLWQGSFYKPWDWRKIKQREQNVKVIRKKTKKSGLFGF